MLRIAVNQTSRRHVLQGPKPFRSWEWRLWLIQMMLVSCAILMCLAQMTKKCSNSALLLESFADSFPTSPYSYNIALTPYFLSFFSWISVNKVCVHRAYAWYYTTCLKGLTLNKQSYVERFEDSAAKCMRSALFLDVTQRMLGVSISWPLKMEPIGCPETSVRNYQYILRDIPKNPLSPFKSNEY